MNQCLSIRDVKEPSRNSPPVATIGYVFLERAKAGVFQHEVWIWPVKIGIQYIHNKWIVAMNCEHVSLPGESRQRIGSRIDQFLYRNDLFCPVVDCPENLCEASGSDELDLRESLVINDPHP